MIAASWQVSLWMKRNTLGHECYVAAEQWGDGAGERLPQLALLLQRALGRWRRKEKIETWELQEEKRGSASREAAKMKEMRFRGRRGGRRRGLTMGRSEHRFVDGGKSW